MARMAAVAVALLAVMAAVAGCGARSPGSSRAAAQPTVSRFVTAIAMRPGGVNWLEFSEAIITGPPPVLNSLADPALPASCRKIDGRAGYAGGVRALAEPRVGLGSRAYQITGTGRVPVWQWAEVARGPGFVLEVRIPVQAPSPGDPGRSLGGIVAAAYHRAAATLSP